MCLILGISMVYDWSIFSLHVLKQNKENPLYSESTLIASFVFLDFQNRIYPTRILVVGCAAPNSLSHKACAWRYFLP